MISSHNKVTRSYQLGLHDAALCKAQELCEHALQCGCSLTLEERGEQHGAAALERPGVCSGGNALQLGEGDVEELAVLGIGKVLPAVRCLG